MAGLVWLRNERVHLLASTMEGSENSRSWQHRSLTRLTRICPVPVVCQSPERLRVQRSITSAGSNRKESETESCVHTHNHCGNYKIA